MSRWIDADALVIDYYDDYETKDDIYTYAYVSEVQIDSAPSIDIVRCGECSKRKKNKFCLEHKRYEKDDYGYCSYGEREGERSDE